MIILSDISIISGLFAIGKLDILSEGYGSVIIPQLVNHELQVLKAFGYDLSPIEEA